MANQHPMAWSLGTLFQALTLVSLPNNKIATLAMSQGRLGSTRTILTPGRFLLLGIKEGSPRPLLLYLFLVSRAIPLTTPPIMLISPWDNRQPRIS